MIIDVVSANYGDYDTIIAPPDSRVRNHILVTDVIGQQPGWEVVYEPRPHLHPNVAAKYPKLFPFSYSDADATVWIDSSAGWDDSLFDAVEVGLASHDSTMFRHPNRDDIADEVAASRTLPKYDDLPMEQQASYYYEAGYQRNGGMWATGVIGRKNTPPNTQFSLAWMSEMVRWGFQDQLSFAYLATVAHPSPIGRLGPDLWASPFIHFGGHKR